MAELLRIHEILHHLEVTNAMLAAEFGCGSAHIAMALAKKMPRGRVYAIDIQHERLSAIEGQLAHAHLKNVVAIHGDVEAVKGSTLRDSMLDIVVIPNTLFQAKHTYAIIQEAHRTLKSGGQLLIVDWLKAGPFSPQSLISVKEVKALAKKSKFTLTKEFAAGDYHYGLVFTK